MHGFACQVLFQQACARIPKGALCLEVGPHALLRTPLRQNRRARPLHPALSTPLSTAILSIFSRKRNRKKGQAG